MPASSSEETIFRIPPYFFLHVLDQNTNVTRVEVGPQTFVRQDNERVLSGPSKMIVVPPRHYCVIENPVVKNDKGEVQFDASGQVRLMHADLEVRRTQDPFPLYPGESVKQSVTPLKIVTANTALRLRAILDFEDEDGTHRVAGDEWLFEGPGTYIPRKEVAVDETIRSTIIKPNQAIRLRARKETFDRNGIARVTGQEWQVTSRGAYLPGAYEEVIDTVDAVVLTEKKALHLQAKLTFKDVYGKTRKSGEEWLVTFNDAETHIPDVYEEVLGIINITTLTNRQYCVVMDPVDANGKPQLGQKKVVQGEISFFLQPGEYLQSGIQDVYILGEDDGLIIKASFGFVDHLSGDVERRPGELWLIRGPCDYVPTAEVEVVTRRKAIPLDENEGIYVRDIKTGKVRSVVGETYMLTQDEELWQKDMSPAVEALLAQSKDPVADRSDRAPKADSSKPRDRTRVVSYRVPHNAACQIYDYKLKKARVVFGPDLVMLGPDEQFTQLSISGGKPKRPNVIKSLCLLLGPDFMTDIIVVETSDHARLSLQLSYNWHFDVKEQSIQEAAKIFSVPDFVGDCCKAIASRVRGAVASVPFDDFHKNSAKIIRSSVFGRDENGKVKSHFEFPQNSLRITSIDIQSVEPVDQRTRDALQKSVQLAIEITTNSQEATARQEAERLEQEAQGRLERQKLVDEAEAEKTRRNLLELQANSAAVESTGQAKAEAQSRAEAARIEGEAAVEQAKLKAEASNIEANSELSRLKEARAAELDYVRAQNELEINKTKNLAAIETEKFANMVDAIGRETIRDMANAGPATQAKLLAGLGIKSTLITDGNSPINLFTTAKGLMGPMGHGAEDN